MLYSHKDYCKQVPQPLPNSGGGFAPGQSVAILPNPLMQCSTIASVRCGGTQGCCSAGGCCGAGCCGLTAICINQNTRPVCCSLGDPTRCGTKRPSVCFSFLVSIHTTSFWANADHHCRPLSPRPGLAAVVAMDAQRYQIA